MPIRIKSISNTRTRPFSTVREAQHFLSSKAWRRLSKAKLRANPICECSFGPDGKSCGELASEVHHVIDRAERPDLALEWNNLASMTKRCHTRITSSRIKNRST